MTQGSAFGRRSTPSVDAASGRRRQIRTAEAGQSAPAEEASGDPLEKAFVYSVGAAGAVVVFALALWLLMPTGTSSAADPSTPAQTEAAARAPEQSSLADAAQAGEPASGTQTEPAARKAVASTGGTVSPELRKAALSFFGFYHLNSRTRSAYCAKLGVDMAAFSAKFRQSQSLAHARATAVAQAAGLTEEQIWTQSRAELDGLIDADMEKIGRQIGMGPNGACAVMVQMADNIVPGIDFAKVMPDAHRTLMGS